MANPLTGQFDAAVEVDRRTLNRLLASMHQAEEDEKDLPTAPHRLVLEVEGLPGLFAGIRGTAFVQAGVPSVSLVAPSPHEVDVECWIRARYRADPASVPFPEFVHGKVRVRVGVELTSEAGVPGFRVTASQDDAHVTFSESGLAGADLAKATLVIRWLLRTRLDAFLPLPADLPAENVPPIQGLADAAGHQAVALPLTLAASGFFGGIGSVVESVAEVIGGSASPAVFVEPGDFAAAVSKGYLLSLFDEGLKAIKNAIPSEINVAWGLVTFDVSVTKLAVDLIPSTPSTPGGFRVQVKVHAHSDNVIPKVPNDIDAGVIQDVNLVLDDSPLRLPTLVAGPLTVGVSGDDNLSNGKAKEIENNIRAQVIPAREKALQAIQAPRARIEAILADLTKLLRRIDQSAGVRFDGIPEVRPDEGVILRGIVSLSPRKPPRVEFDELPDGSGYTAFDGWIPGGRVTKYQWTWWYSGDQIDPVTNAPKVHKASYDDRFVLLRSAEDHVLPTLQPTDTVGGAGSGGDVSSASLEGGPGTDVIVAPGGIPFTGPAESAHVVWGQACLRVLGVQIDPKTGQQTSIESTVAFDPGLKCVFGMPKPVIYVQKKVLVRLPQPDPLVGAVVPIEIDLIGGAGPARERFNWLIHLVGPEALAAVTTLEQALRAAERRDAGLLVTLLFAPGALARTAPGLSQALRGLRRELPRLRLMAAEYVEGDWMRALQLPADGAPGMRLVDPEGRPVWGHDGAVERAALTEAFRRYLVPSGVPRPRLRGLAVRAGQLAPDFSFDVGPGRRMALRRFRGRRVLLVFIRAGSPGSLAVLSRLQRGKEQFEPDQTAVLAVLDGADIETVTRLRRELGLAFATIPDPDGVIGRLYGVACWPTMVSIDPDRRVATTRMGADPGALGAWERAS
jgi:peroxiredoxin